MTHNLLVRSQARIVDATTTLAFVGSHDRAMDALKTHAGAVLKAGMVKALKSRCFNATQKRTENRGCCPLSEKNEAFQIEIRENLYFLNSNKNNIAFLVKESKPRLFIKLL